MGVEKVQVWRSEDWGPCPKYLEKSVMATERAHNFYTENKTTEGFYGEVMLSVSIAK